MLKQRIYLDNAATSWPKPEAVYGAVDQYLRRIGAAAGRGGYHEAIEADRLLRRTRAHLARLLEAEDERHIVFTSSGTDSLNLALHGLLRPGDHVITTAAEHNSVLRPLRFLEQHRSVDVTRLPLEARGTVDPQSVAKSIRSSTRLIAVTHASNVTGAIQPVGQIGAIAREHNLFFLLDAAQTIGHVPVTVTATSADLIAAPGHKGLLGPTGTGILYVGPRVAQQLMPLRQGGTGTQSENDWQPDNLPDKYEAGNHNMPGIAGLGAGVDYVLERGIPAIRQHEQHLATQLVEGLTGIPGVQLYGPGDADARVAVVSMNLTDYDPQELAAILDSGAGVQVRAGLHCAPLVHRSLGTFDRGGTVRFSFGPFNDSQDVDSVLQALRGLV